MKRFATRGLAIATALTMSVGLAACANTSDEAATTTATSTATDTATVASAAKGEAKTLENCGNTIEVNGVPQKVLLVNRAGVVPTLDAIGALENVHMRAGAFPDEYFSPEVATKIAAIPNLTDKMDASGHLQISKEEVVGTNSDLIIGYAGNVDYTAMAGTGVPIIEEPGFCGSLEGDASWEHVWDHIRFYGKLFEQEEAAEQYITETKKRLEEASAKKAGEGLTVAVLYPATDGSINYAYGTRSMSHPIVEAAGMTNVFADATDRVFEVSDEELIARNPDVIISLHSEGGEDAAKVAVEGVRNITGINETNAAKNDAILPMLLYFAEPPSGMSIDGLEQLNDFLEQR